MKKAKIVLFFLIVASMIAGTSSSSYADALSFRTTFFDTDFVSAGVGGMRDGPGTGTIALTGVTGTVTSASLYWHGPGDSSDPMANANVTFNGTGITGTSLGLSNDNCWDYNNSKAYWADVTSLVSGDGNYALSNFVKSSENINGVSLLVAFDDGDGTNNRDIAVFHGNDSNIDNIYDTPGWNITLSGINYTSGTATLEMHVADGQDWLDDSILINGVELVGPPGSGIFQGDSTPPSPKDASHNGNLWDIKQFDVTSFLSPGLNDLNMTSGVFSDCLACIVAIIDLPAGAAPPIDEEPPVGVPEPATILLLGSGLIGLATVRRRMNK